VPDRGSGLSALRDSSTAEDPWGVELDVTRAHMVPAGPGPRHQPALTFRYLDGARYPRNRPGSHKRTVHATETLLVRVRRAYRQAYERPLGRRAAQAV
jgi:RNA polymerase sigma-70 factor (ECF subfamily)